MYNATLKTAMPQQTVNSSPTATSAPIVMRRLRKVYLDIIEIDRNKCTLVGQSHGLQALIIFHNLLDPNEGVAKIIFRQPYRLECAEMA